MLLPVAGVFFSSLVYFCRRLNLFCLSSFLAGSTVLSHEETDFKSLALGFSGREKSLAVVS